MGIVATFAVAGYIGYRNKEMVLWNGVKLYDSIKDYCVQFEDTFKLDTIIVFNGNNYFQLESTNWRNVPIYLIGFYNKDNPNHINSKIGVEYRLNGKKYFKLYNLFPDNEKVEDMIDDITELNKYNKKTKINKVDSHINYILSATYFDGFEYIDVTELLHIFDIDGDFYKNNDKISFEDMLEWCNKLNLSRIYKEEDGWTHKGEGRYIEIINLFGEIKTFMPKEILKFEI